MSEKRLRFVEIRVLKRVECFGIKEFAMKKIIVLAVSVMSLTSCFGNTADVSSSYDSSSYAKDKVVALLMSKENNGVKETITDDNSMSFTMTFSYLQYSGQFCISSDYSKDTDSYKAQITFDWGKFEQGKMFIDQSTSSSYGYIRSSLNVNEIILSSCPTIYRVSYSVASCETNFENPTISATRALEYFADALDWANDYCMRGIDSSVTLW